MLALISNNSFLSSSLFSLCTQYFFHVFYLRSPWIHLFERPNPCNMTCFTIRTLQSLQELHDSWLKSPVCLFYGRDNTTSFIISLSYNLFLCSFWSAHSFLIMWTWLCFLTRWTSGELAQTDTPFLDFQWSFLESTASSQTCCPTRLCRPEGKLIHFWINPAVEEKNRIRSY